MSGTSREVLGSQDEVTFPQYQDSVREPMQVKERQLLDEEQLEEVGSWRTKGQAGGGRDGIIVYF